ERLPRPTPLLSARGGVCIIGFLRGYWRLPPHSLRSCIYESRHPQSVLSRFILRSGQTEAALTKRELAGAPFLVSQRLLIALASGLPRAAVSASQNGVLAYRTRIDTGSAELVWFDRAGKRLE